MRCVPVCFVLLCLVLGMLASMLAGRCCKWRLAAVAVWGPGGLRAPAYLLTHHPRLPPARTANKIAKPAHPPNPTPPTHSHHTTRAAVCVSYWANRLQPLPPGAPNLFVTLNPIEPPAEDKTFRRLTLSHPVFSFASDAAQRALPAAQVGLGLGLGLVGPVQVVPR